MNNYIPELERFNKAMREMQEGILEMEDVKLRMTLLLRLEEIQSSYAGIIDMIADFVKNQ